MTHLHSVFLQLIKWSILEKVHCLVLQTAAVTSTAVLVFYWAVISGSGISGTIHAPQCSLSLILSCHRDQLSPTFATLRSIPASISIDVQVQE